MKNKLSLIVSVSAAVLMPFAALAHEAVAAETSTEQRQQMQVDRQKGLDAAKTERAALEEKARQMRDEVKSKQEELRREMQTRMEELKKKLGEQKAVRIEQYFSQMMEKFQTAIDRLKGVADKIESRLTSSTADPANLAVLQTKLTAARAKIGEAEAALADAKVKYTDAVNSTDFKESFKKVRALVEGVAVKVKEAHRALVDVTSSIKELGARGRSSSTTTPAQ